MLFDDLTILDLDVSLPPSAFSADPRHPRVFNGSEASHLLPSEFHSCLVLADASNPTTLHRLESLRDDARDARTLVTFALMHDGAWSADALRTLTSLSMLALEVTPTFEGMTLTHSASRTLATDRRLAKQISTLDGLERLLANLWIQTHLDILGWQHHELSEYETKWSLQHALPSGPQGTPRFSWTPHVFRAHGGAMRARPLSEVLRVLRSDSGSPFDAAMWPAGFPADLPILGFGAVVTVLTGWYLLRLFGDLTPVRNPQDLLNEVRARAGSDSTPMDQLSAVASLSEHAALHALQGSNDSVCGMDELFGLGRVIPTSFGHLLSNADDTNALLLDRIWRATTNAEKWSFSRSSGGNAAVPLYGGAAVEALARLRESILLWRDPETDQYTL